ncbi:cupin domain-containing protein [Aureitalea marina]|uniref:cupin domain-containing protein n=1 Tax=Aureitalea marina TaxID=930804 RepID=UPI00269329CD
MEEIQQLVQQLRLLPHPEGGYYRETYRSDGLVSDFDLGNGQQAVRNYSTAIYFLLTQGNFSAFHRIRQDEVWHHYKGDSIRLHMIDPLGEYSEVKIGKDIASGEQLQFMVPAGYWFASEVEQDGQYALVGCTVAPDLTLRTLNWPMPKTSTRDGLNIPRSSTA